MDYIVDWNKITLANNFVFCRVMEAEPELCRKLVELLLGFEVKKIKIVKSEYALKAGLLDKGIRMDVYCKADDRVIDLEMQTVVKSDLAKRTRYYQSLIDMDLLTQGKPYSSLKESYIVFLCLSDPLKQNLPVYFFENACREMPEVKLNDGAYKVFFNAEKCAIMGNEKLKAFFEFLRGQEPCDTFTDKLNRIVEKLKTDAMFRGQYMTWEQSIHEEAEYRAEKMAKKMAKKMAQNMAKDIAQDMAKDMQHAKALEAARTLLSMHLGTHEQIAQAQGLTVAEVQQLAAEQFVR